MTSTVIAVRAAPDSLHWSPAMPPRAGANQPSPRRRNTRGMAARRVARAFALVLSGILLQTRRDRR